MGGIPQTELHALAALQNVGPAVSMPAESARPAAAPRPLLRILTSWREGNDRGPVSRPPSLSYKFPRLVFPGIITPQVLFRVLGHLPVWRPPPETLQGHRASRGGERRGWVAWWPLALTIALSHELLTSSMLFPHPPSVSQRHFFSTSEYYGDLQWAAALGRGG